VLRPLTPPASADFRTRLPTGLDLRWVPLFLWCLTGCCSTDQPPVTPHGMV